MNSALTSLFPASNRHEIFTVVWHTFVIYLFLIILFRLLGRRQLGQLNVIDLVVIIILGSAVETAMVAGNTHLDAGIVCAITLLATNRAISAVAKRSKRFRRLLCGNPVLLVRNGQFIEEHLKRTGFSHEDVMQAVRERERDSLSDIRFVVLELDGAITVVPNDAKIYSAKLGELASGGE